jgi:carbonic anhydrase/acetyltransferase-like protein (isoleucine patch superfamily)
MLGDGWRSPATGDRNGSSGWPRQEGDLQMAHIYAFNGKYPKIADNVFLAPDAFIIGDVEIGPGSSVWFGCVLRGDVGPIRIGERTNLQEHTMVHLDEGIPTILGDDVTVGHRAIIHGTTVANGTLIGMGAIVLSGSKIGSGSIVGAGALVPERAEIPDGSLALGMPARVRRETSEQERVGLIEQANRYRERGERFRELMSGQ